MGEIKISERQRADNIKSAKNFTLFDDTFMTVVFDGNLECTSYVISIILGKNLTATEVKAQNTIQNLKGRSIRLDIKAVDSENRLYNIEVQREETGAKPKRARYNGSLMDSNCEDSGEYGEKLPETYVIFITEKDYWKKGEPLYAFERKFVTSKGETIDLNDELHIIYVNGQYRGDDKIGDLMHDFSCTNPAGMKSNILRKHIVPYKDNEGVIKMCRIMEESNRRAVEEDREERNKEIILNLLKKNMSIESIADVLNLSKEKILELQEELDVVTA